VNLICIYCCTGVFIFFNNFKLFTMFLCYNFVAGFYLLLSTLFKMFDAEADITFPTAISNVLPPTILKTDNTPSLRICFLLLAVYLFSTCLNKFLVEKHLKVYIISHIYFVAPWGPTFHEIFSSATEILYSFANEFLNSIIVLITIIIYKSITKSTITDFAVTVRV
jgi:hypothetical protein